MIKVTPSKNVTLTDKLANSLRKLTFGDKEEAEWYLFFNGYEPDDWGWFKFEEIRE